MRRSCRLFAVWAFAAGCTRTPAPPSAPARYLFAWAYDLDERAGDSNFVAVIAVDPASPDYGRVVATATTGAAGGMPHHTEQLMPAAGLPLVANAFHADRSALLDLRDPIHPAVVGQLAPAPGFHMPHSFFRLPDGNILATLQFGDGSTPGNLGGLRLRDRRAHVLFHRRLARERRVGDGAGAAVTRRPVTSAART